MLEKGDRLPGYLGLDAGGNRVNTDDFAGRKLIVYFYPKDNTPGCTAEACSLRDSYGELSGMGYTIVGISKDSAASHGKFAAKHSLPFTLLSDPDAEVAKSYGVWQLKKLAGREYMGMVRTTFVADEAHVVTEVVAKVNTKAAGEQLLEILK